MRVASLSLSLSSRSSMEEAKDDVHLIRLAIERLMEEKKNYSANDSGDDFVADDDDGRLLQRLLSQLESLKRESSVLTEPEPSAGPKETPSAVQKKDVKSNTADKLDDSNTEIGAEEIVKELKKVKRQNSITHWLLSTMLLLTFAWQLSEITLILKVKNGLSHPFKSFGGMLFGMLKGPGINGQDSEKQSSTTKQLHIEAPSPLPIEIPELPQVDIPVLGLNVKDN
ncbi:uncharacterized protein LOC131144770 [Malania oleifera]|uniref:uncharacterized protein LOC131144770 n=1 Tax=Malania oleifera TaxID=397392 RepID=UPI0025AEC50B|nr:uncharacterized protein LOC131144770 [Malania oleifera]